MTFRGNPLTSGKCFDFPSPKGGSATRAEVMQYVKRLIRILRKLAEVKSGKSPAGDLLEKVQLKRTPPKAARNQGELSERPFPK